MRILARLASLTDDDLRGRATWRGRESDARYALLHSTLEAEQGAVVRARLAYRGTEAQRILGLAQVAYGDLRGLLAGVPAALLDRAPREGEWSARETLVHTIGVERSYRANTAFALVRSAEDPLTLPAERRPQPDPGDTAGHGSEIALRLGTRRAETDADLGRIRDDQLTLPSAWGSHSAAAQIDVRFRLHRFASHLVEHTVQCERALEAAGLAFADARRIARRISVVRAMHERITPADELARLDAAHAETLGAVGTAT